MPDLRDLPVAFKTFSGDPSTYTPAFENEILWKTDSVGGAEGIYRATGATAGNLTPAAAGGGLETGTASPIGVVTPNGVNQVFIEHFADATNRRTVFYRSTGLANTDWVAFGGPALYREASSSYISNVVPDFIGQLGVHNDTGYGGGQDLYIATGLTNSDWELVV